MKRDGARDTIGTDERDKKNVIFIHNICFVFFLSAAEDNKNLNYIDFYAIILKY